MPKLTDMKPAAEGGLADLLLSNPRGSQIKTYDFNGKPLRVMLMDPTVDDWRWYMAEFHKYNGSSAMKEGRAAVPPHTLADILIKGIYHPLDYGQSDEEKAANANPAFAGTPIFTEIQRAAIVSSTEKVFLDMARDWSDRSLELYGAKEKDEGKNQ